MRNRILSVGKLAKETLKNPDTSIAGKSISGQVIAVFENSAYLQSTDPGNNCVCIGTLNLVHGPINVQTSYIKLPEITLNSIWYSKDNVLYLEVPGSPQSCSIDLSGAREYRHVTDKNQILHWPQTEFTDDLLSQFHPAPNQKPSGGSNHQERLQQTLQNGLLAISDWVRSGSKTVPESVIQLLGCGEGLTPSGDDILIGALIALDYTAQDSAFNTLANSIVQHAPERTNTISLAHLNAACQAMAVAPLHEFVRTFFSHNETMAETCDYSSTTSLCNYGHRSGIDAMCGVLAVAKAGIPAQVDKTPRCSP